MTQDNEQENLADYLLKNTVDVPPDMAKVIEDKIMDLADQPNQLDEDIQDLTKDFGIFQKGVKIRTYDVVAERRLHIERIMMSEPNQLDKQLEDIVSRAIFSKNYDQLSPNQDETVFHFVIVLKSLIAKAQTQARIETWIKIDANVMNLTESGAKYVESMLQAELTQLNRKDSDEDVV